MRASLIAFSIAALVAASMTATSAFNYASLQGRTVAATIVQEDGAYIAIANHDTDYACFVAYTAGKIDVTWDSGTSCPGTTGSGINPESTYYYHDVLKITNKGTKTWTGLWLNMTDTAITINTKSTAGAMATGDTYAQNVYLTTNLAPGNVWYIGYKIDASALNTGSSPSKTMTIQARASN